MGNCCTRPVGKEAVELNELFKSHEHKINWENHYLTHQELRLAYIGGRDSRWPRWKARVMCQFVFQLEHCFYKRHCDRPSAFDLQIEKDVTRTMPEHPFFHSGQNQQRLGKVLRAISHFFPSVGYVQGMNFFVGLLLLVSDSQSESFWFFVHLALHHDYLLIGLYTEGLGMYKFLQFVVEKRLEIDLPQLAPQLSSLEKGVWLPNFLQGAFVNVLPFSVLLTFWDFIILTRGSSVVSLTLAIVQELGHQLEQGGLGEVNFSTVLKKYSHQEEFIQRRLYRILKAAVILQLTPAAVSAHAREYSLIAPDNQFADLLCSYDCPRERRRRLKQLASSLARGQIFEMRPTEGEREKRRQKLSRQPSTSTV